MAWMHAIAAAGVLGCAPSRLARVAKDRGIQSKRETAGHQHRIVYDVPMRGKMSPEMYRTVPATAVMEHWRQWAVDVGLISETDEMERLIVDIDAGEDRARFWVEKKGDMRQLAVKPPAISLE